MISRSEGMTVKPFPQSRASISTGFPSVQRRAEPVLADSMVFFTHPRQKALQINVSPAV
jgi:hypothetical protein